MKDWFQEASKPPENSLYDISSEDICLKQPLFVTQHGKVLWFTWHFSTLHPKRDWMHYVNGCLFPRAVNRPCQYNDIAGPISLSCPLASAQTRGEALVDSSGHFFGQTKITSSFIPCHMIWDVRACGSNTHNMYADIHKWIIGNRRVGLHYDSSHQSWTECFKDGGTRSHSIQLIMTFLSFITWVMSFQTQMALSFMYECKWRIVEECSGYSCKT